MLVALEEGRCACATARYAASQAVASPGRASTLLLRLCAAVWPARHAAHSPQVVVLGEEGSSCCSWPRGGEVRVCKSTVRGLSGSGIAGRSECTAAAAVCGLAACTARRALTKDRWAQRAESPAGRGTRGRSERSRLPVEGAGGRNERSRRYRSWDWWAQRAASSAGHGTGRRSERSRLLVMGLVGASSGVTC